jgi:hypothetical protein
MPNNNPQGRNQYTKRKEQQQNTGNADSPPATPAEQETGTAAKRGFAAMDEETQREIASKGGQSQGKENNPGNFANDRERAREAGRKGGEAHGANR